MTESLPLTRIERWRSAFFLTAIAVTKRLTLGCRAVMIEGNSVYLIRQTYMPGWQFPGGGVEPGETAEVSAGRELEEEAGYRPLEPMALHGLFHHITPATNRDHVAVYLCRSFERVHEAAPNREIAAGGWFPIDALPEPMEPGTRRRIEEIFHGAALTPRW